MTLAANYLISGYMGLPPQENFNIYGIIQHGQHAALYLLASST